MAGKNDALMDAIARGVAMIVDEERGDRRRVGQAADEIAELRERFEAFPPPDSRRPHETHHGRPGRKGPFNDLVTIQRSRCGRWPCFQSAGPIFCSQSEAGPPPFTVPSGASC